MTKKQLNLVETVPRILAGAVGLLFLALGIGFLTLPEVFATQFFVEPARAVGINSIRGDFGALFLGMSFFCLLGTLTAHRRLLLVPIVFLSLVVTGRVASFIVDDVPMVMADSIVMELIFIVILTLSVVTSKARKEAVENTVSLRGIVNYRLLASVAVILILVAAIFLSRKRIAMRLFQTVTTQKDTEINFLEAYLQFKHSILWLTTLTYYDYEKDISLMKEFRSKYGAD